MRNFNEIFRKSVTYENIQSHKKAGLHLFSRRYIFRKTIGGRVKLTPYSFQRLQKQPSRGVLIERCSENVHQTYKRTPLLKYDFNKVAQQLYRNHTLAWVFCQELYSDSLGTFNTDCLSLLLNPELVTFPRNVSFVLVNCG